MSCITRDRPVNAVLRDIFASMDTEMEANVTVLMAKMTAIEVLLDMLWTDRIAKEENPQEVAHELAEHIKRLVDDDLYVPFNRNAYEALSDRLEAIKRRVESL